MEQAKKLNHVDKESFNDLHIEKDDLRAIERRYSFDYKSLATSSIRHANTSPLESFVQDIEKEEFSKGTLLDSVLYYAPNLLQQMGYTHSLIESQSYRKLKKVKRGLEKQVASTDEQIVHLNQNITKIDEYVATSLADLKMHQNEASSQKKKLALFEKELLDYRGVAKTSLDPKTHMYLQQAELDYHIDEQRLGDLQETCEVAFSMIQEYYAQKSQELSLRSIFEGNKIILSSLVDKVHLELDRSSRAHPIQEMSRNRGAITDVYKIQELLLERDTKLTHLYNKKVENLPSYAKMSSTIMKQRQSLPKIKR